MIEEFLFDHIGPEVKIKEIRKTLYIENNRLILKLTVIPEVEMQDVTIEINLVD